MRIIVRGFADKKVQFEDELNLSLEDLDELIPDLAKKHGKAMAAHKLHMIEIEFPDEPEEERYFRFGSDPSGMLMPIRIL
jgi:hypothetical protein